jgi:hypothetical protein
LSLSLFIVVFPRSWTDVDLGNPFQWWRRPALSIMPGQPVERSGLKLGLMELYQDATASLTDWASQTIGARRGTRLTAVGAAARRPSAGAGGYEEIPMVGP